MTTNNQVLGDQSPVAFARERGIQGLALARVHMEHATSVELSCHHTTAVSASWEPRPHVVKGLAASSSGIEELPEARGCCVAFGDTHHRHTRSQLEQGCNCR